MLEICCYSQEAEFPRAEFVDRMVLLSFGARAPRLGVLYEVLISGFTCSRFS